MKIQTLRIVNIHSYEDQEIHFDHYNIVVGPNASGKSNIVRTLELVCQDNENRRAGGMLPVSLDSITLQPRIKFDEEKPSAILLDLILSKDEIKTILQFILKKNITDFIYKELSKVNVIILWPYSPDTFIRPKIVILRFANGFTLWEDSGKNYLLYIEKLPKNIIDLLGLPSPYSHLSSDNAEKYHKIQGFYSNALPHEEKFKSTENTTLPELRVIVGSIIGSARDSPLFIRVNVTDVQGNPVGDAPVSATVINSSGYVKTFYGVTTSAGIWTFAWELPHSYTERLNVHVKASKAGYEEGIADELIISSP